MIPSRHSFPLRILTVAFLLWIGLDFGAHGLFASGSAPLGGGPITVRTAMDETPVGSCCTPDHCFCHGLSVGAVAAARTIVLDQTGDAVASLPSRVPHGDRHPPDQPPRLAA